MRNMKEQPEMTGIDTMQRRLKGNKMLLMKYTKTIGIGEYNKSDYVNFDVLTIKELACF